MISLTLLVENTARTPEVLGEHGLAYWIELPSRRVLFDTGQGLTLRGNAIACGVDLSRADAVVLSHGHYDHVGGLATALHLAPAATVYLHPRAIEPKFSASGGAGVRRISVSFVEQERFRQPGRKVVVTAEPQEVAPGLWTTGEIPRTNDFEDPGGAFYLDPAAKVPDPLLDDQAVFFRSEDGVVVLLGCAHAGVVNTLVHVTRLTGGQPIHTVIGGMHLLHASPRRMEETMAALRRFDVQRLAPLHCTGDAPICRIRGEFPDRFVSCGAGSRLTFACRPSGSPSTQMEAARASAPAD